MTGSERALLQKLAQSSPEDLMDTVLHADVQEERVLRIYLGPAQFEQIRAVASSTRGVRGGPALGNVVVLHGIMGGELTLFNNDGQSLVWLQVWRLMQGQFDRLEVDAKGFSVRDVRASGIYMRYYGSQLVALSREWNVRPFFYDWRRDIRIAADELYQSINTWFGPDAPVHIVAHSMGGLVARSYIVRHQDRWAKGGRLVMLGTPNYGSFAITRLLSGTNDVLALVAKIDFSHDSRALLNIAKTFPGAYQMLPARTRLAGLDTLYQAGTYTVVPIDQSLLDQAQVFQAEIAGAVDPARMVYVAGYNRRTMAGLTDPTQLANDAGYFFSRKGDGTVPHNLGLLDGVKTFYVDEEHSALPANSLVQSAMTELIQTGDQRTEQYLYKGLGSDFLGERGLGEESQSTQLAGEAARRSVKEQQALALRNVLASRGDSRGDTVSPEEMALADVILRHDPLPLSVATDSGVGASVGSAAAPPAGSVSTALVQPDTSARLAPPHTSIRVRVLPGRIDQIPRLPFADEKPVDCIAAGHYLRVSLTGAEHDLDVVVSPHLSGAPPAPGADTNEDLLLSQFHERGILRGDLGVPFFLPDPRPGYEGGLIAIAGMGPAGGFGVPELILLARELSWSLGQLGKKHLATVLIGSSNRNLSISDAIHGWMVGLNRALASAAGADARGLEAVTFVILPATGTQDAGILPAVVTALEREKAAMQADPMFNFDVQLIGMPAVTAQPRTATGPAGATRVAIDFENGMCRYSALTDGAAVAERVFRINPRRITDVNARLLATDDAREKYRLGRFLLDFLFPADLRNQLTGSAPIVLACNNEAAKVYWELAAQPVDEADLGVVQPYLGLARGLTRQLRTVLAPPPEPPPPVGRILRVLLVADTCKEHPLPGAHQEAQLLLELFERINAANSLNQVSVTALIGPSKATTLDVLLRISDQPPFDILHYAGHCIFDRDNPAQSGFLFSGDDRLTADDLDRVDRTPRFVFANACESGVLPSRPDLSSPELPAAFAESFFKKGVGNFICTAWPVGDQPSRDFALELYRYLLGDGVPVSPLYEALRMARQKISTTRTWGAYQHYGTPYYRVFRRS